MGTTATSLHIVAHPALRPVYVAEIGKAIAKLGYREAKAGAIPDKRVVIAVPDGPGFVSIYDEANARLDSGELRELACLLSGRIKLPVVLTSIYDSDRASIEVFDKGKQIDFVGDEAEPRDAATPRLAAKARQRTWARIFGGPMAAQGVSADAIAEAARPNDPAMADEALGRWCRAIGLDPAAASVTFSEVAEASGGNRVQLSFTLTARQAQSTPAAPGEVTLRSWRDDDDRPEHVIFPAAWPVRTGSSHVLQWLVVSESAGFEGIRLHLHMTGDEAWTVDDVQLGVYPFHSGQVMGSALAVHRWEGPLDPSAALEAPSIAVPSPVAGSRARKVIIVRVQLAARALGLVHLAPALEVSSPAMPPFACTPLRVQSIVPAWTPRVYRPLPERRSAADPLYPGQAQREEALLLLNGEGVLCTAAIVPASDTALAAVRTLVVELVAALSAAPGLTAVVRTETQMTAAGSSSRNVKAVDVTAPADDAALRRAFAAEARYQNVSVEVSVPGFAAPVAGVVMHVPFDHVADVSRVDGQACTAIAWLIPRAWDHDADHAPDPRTVERVRDLSADWVAARSDLLQGWQLDSAWRPQAMTPDGAGTVTPYETVAGLDGRRALEAGDIAWCGRTLRCVAPRLWLGAALAGRADLGALRNVADVAATGTSVRVDVRGGKAHLARVEAALAALLPEHARMS